VLPAVPGSMGVGGSEKCGAEHEHQVRLLDATGVTWTVGWDVDGPVDDASTDGIGVGALLTLAVANRSGGAAGSDVAIALSDATGPVLFVERVSYQPLLTPEDRGGISVVTSYADGCLGTDPYGYRALQRPVTFEGPYGTVILNAGASGLVTLADRTLDVTVGMSLLSLDGGADGMSAYGWTAWEDP